MAAAPEAPPPNTRRWSEYVIFAGWLVAVLVPVSTVTALHVWPIVRQTPEARADARPDGVTVRHVLASDCKCSQAVFERLVSRRASPVEREEVWWIGGTPPASLTEAGYRARAATADEARSSLGAVGAPLLVVYGATGAELYAGGYADRRIHHATDVQDLEIVAESRAGRAPRAKPLWGCLTGASPRQSADPFGLKYDTKQAGARP